MPVAEIITIGTELLLGEIQDTNTRFLARTLRDAGIDLFRTMMVGDNEDRIAQAIQESLQRSDIIITTGGLGPTVDDPTRQAVAKAVHTQNEYHPELWDQIAARFQKMGRVPGENNRRQAYIPAGSIPIENPVGTAPAFIVEQGSRCVISLPGVPNEMEYLLQNRVMPYLREKYQLRGLIKALVLHTAGVGESAVDDLVGDLELYSNPSVGLLAHPGQVDIRITAKANSSEEADAMLQPLASLIRERLGDHIFGEDNTTLESAVESLLTQLGIDLIVLESGMGGALTRRLEHAPHILHLQSLAESLDRSAMMHNIQKLQEAKHAQYCLAVNLDLSSQMALVIFGCEDKLVETARQYTGPQPNSPNWAANLALDFVRRNLISQISNR
jgi:nicotinamide-nucleotide amidase